MEQFVELVKKHFQYLLDDYGFSVVDERYEPQVFGNSLVQFHSSNMEIMIVLDRGHVSIDISPHPNPLGYQFGLSTILEYLVPEVERLAYDYSEAPDDYYSRIIWQITRFAPLLHEHCDKVLRGEFSDWKEMDERREKRALREYRALTGKDPIKIESEEFRDILQEEINHRVANRKREVESSPQSNNKKPISWWAFWRKK